MATFLLLLSYRNFLGLINLPFLSIASLLKHLLMVTQGLWISLRFPRKKVTSPIELSSSSSPHTPPLPPKAYEKLTIPVSTTSHGSRSCERSTSPISVPASTSQLKSRQRGGSGPSYSGSSSRPRPPSRRRTRSRSPISGPR